MGSHLALCDSRLAALCLQASPIPRETEVTLSDFSPHKLKAIYDKANL